MKRGKDSLYKFLNFATTGDLNHAKRSGYKIRLADTVSCYYVKIPGRIGKNVVAEKLKDVAKHLKTHSSNITYNVCRIHDIDIDLTTHNFKETARLNEQEIALATDKRLMSIPSSTRAKR
jgi:hypothetical protein